ncbi:MAG: Ca-activated chloride channel family protein, partial [Myxococcota bacterium]
HLTFLVDTSGSMMGTDRLDLVRFGLRTLVGQLRDGDSVAIVTYSGSAGVVLPPTSATDRSTVLTALDRLSAGGSTAMGAGIDAAYRLAHEVYEPGAINRVILCSDGDANVGISGGALLDRIAQEAGTGVALTTVGVGTGDLRDGVMEQLADRGDGVYVYLDSEKEARQVFADRLLSTLQTVARDVKIQVEWDPDAVEAWTLLGYENRAIADEDFRDDAVDAGEVGAGHQVTALYAVKRTAADSDRLGTVRMRYEAPGPEAPAVELEHPIAGVAVDLAQARPDTRIAVAAATLAEKLRERPWASRVSWRALAATVEGAIRTEYADDDRELLELVRRAAELRGE